MKKCNIIFLTMLSILLVSQGSWSQHLMEVEGMAKITIMNTDNEASLIVVKQADGTLAVRDASTLMDGDADITNEIQDLNLSDHILTITLNGSATQIDLSEYMDNTDTQLSEIEVDAFVDNNGYLITEVDGSTTNEIQDLNLNGDILTITQNGSATQIDLSGYLDNTDVQLSEAEVDAYVDNNGYLTIEDQTLEEILTTNTSAGSKQITSLADPTMAQDAATKAYVDLLILQLEIELGIKVQDVDGNLYNTTEIGGQRWMAENLRTTKYNDGTPISLVTDATAWSNLATPGYSYYDNDLAGYSVPYGVMYNYYTVADTSSLNVCPFGWHVPTDAEWTTLTTFLGGLSVAGGKMKDIGTLYWSTPNTGATNETGFTGLPGGFRTVNGAFQSIGFFGIYWSSTEDSPTKAWYHELGYNQVQVVRNTIDKRFGNSVRCLRD